LEFGSIAEPLAWFLPAVAHWQQVRWRRQEQTLQKLLPARSMLSLRQSLAPSKQAQSLARKWSANYQAHHH